MADAVGLDGLHAITGNCDLCGQAVDPTTQELNVLGCTFSDCSGLAYHQDCLEKYLKSIRLERNRKTGFKCPRGCGRGTAFKEACPGRIDKSHPVHPRNEESKKRRKAKLPEPAAPKPPPTKKEKAKQAPEGSKDDQSQTKTSEKQKEKAKQSLAPTPVVVKVLKAAKHVEVPPTKEKLAELVDQARREIAGISSKDQGKDKGSEAASVSRSVATPKQPAASAWGRTASSALLSTSNGSVASSSLETSGSAPAPTLLRRPPVPPNVPVPTPVPTAVPVAHSQASTQAASKLLSQHSEPAPQPAQPARSQSQQHPAHPPSPTPAPVTQHQHPLPPQPPHQQLPIGMDYISTEKEEPKLTKAQKKNLKRAERKKKQVASETASLQSSEQECLAQSEQDSLLFDMFIQALVSHKVLHSLQQLQQLGFSKWACVAAVKRFGCHLEEAVSWLLEADTEDGESVLHSVADACPAIDIDEELQELTALQWQSGLSATFIQEAILENHGDVQKTRMALTDAMDATSMNGSHPSLSHTASCLSVQNGMFAYSVSNDSGDDSSSLHGHFTQESNSILDGLLEPSEPSLTPTAMCGSVPDHLVSQQPAQQPFSNRGVGMAMFHDEQLVSWPAAPGAASGMDAADAAAGAGFDGAQHLGLHQSDNCWHPLMGPSLLLGPRTAQRGTQEVTSKHFNEPLLPDVLISPRDNGVDQLPHVSLFQHASEYKPSTDVYNMYNSASQHQVMGMAPVALQLDGSNGLGYDIKAELVHLPGSMLSEKDASGWMGSYICASTPTSMPPMPALVAAASIAGDEHTDGADEHELNVLLASLRCVT